MLDRIIANRRDRCGNCACAVDFDDPCAKCPRGKWADLGCKQATPPPRPAFPSTGKMAATFASAVKKEVMARLAGKGRVPKEEVERRLGVCAGCEFYHAASGRCIKCGCFLKAKASFVSQACPVGRW